MQNNISAETIAKALGGRRCGDEWSCRCPAHNDRNPSFSIRDGEDGKVLFYCHAGCSQETLIAALQQRGLWAAGYMKWHFKKDNGTQKNAQIALELWESALPIKDSLAEKYLSGRNIVCALPPTLRFSPRCYHTDSTAYFPAMIGKITNYNGTFGGVHRTYLSHNGASKAPLEKSKMMLGTCAGGAVHLASSGETLAVAEGIETALSIMQATSLPTWAALSAPGIERLSLPPLPLASEVIICADNDASGTGLRAAEKAAQRFLREGRYVKIAQPPRCGSDFNDVLLNKECEEEAHYAAA